MTGAVLERERPRDTSDIADWDRRVTSARRTARALGAVVLGCAVVLVGAVVVVGAVGAVVVVGAVVAVGAVVVVGTGAIAAAGPTVATSAAARTSEASTNAQPAAPRQRCAPLTITAGGRYSGCFRSTDPAVPAVSVATDAHVVLHGARIEHAGEGIVADGEGSHITLRDSRLVAVDPDTAEPVSQRAVALYVPRAFTATHNRFSKGHGISINADNDVVDPLQIRYNVSVDIGRFGHPTEPNCCVQFLQLDKVRATADIGWNRTVNRAVRSSIEDNVNLYGSSGLGVRRPLDVHHNLVDGAYPVAGHGRGYTGGGIMAADSGGSYLLVRRNRVVSTTNYGVAIVGGPDNHLVRNRLVNDGRTELGEPSGPDYAVGVALWDPGDTGTMTDVSAHHNVVGWLRGTDLTRNDTWLPRLRPR